MAEFTTEKLISLLRQGATDIENGKITIEDQRELWDVLHWNKNDPENREIIKCLFTGWLLTQSENPDTSK